MSNSQFGFGEESQWGTEATVNEFLPILGEGLTFERNPVYSDAIYAGSRVLIDGNWCDGATVVGGNIDLELYDRGCSTLFKHMFGSQTGLGTDASPHLYGPEGADLTGLGFTAQMGREDVGGTVLPFTYVGGKVVDWSIEVEAGAIAKVGLNTVFKEEVTTTSLATPSYPAGLRPYCYVAGSVTIGGVSYGISKASVTGTNALITDRPQLGSSATREPIEAGGLREYAGEITAELDGMALYDLYKNDSTAEVVLLLAASGSNRRVKLTSTARFTGATPNISGQDLIEQTLGFMGVGTIADNNAAMQVEVVDS